ncbi:hypothetical protein [Streptomyces sp. NPDC001380]|uniref:hypothetical protein n=1 Tax=Streptomyces sp. NPDC001380 TaxID=3364566 RepID=UPI003685F98D
MIGLRAAAWLVEAATGGARRIEARMAEGVTLAEHCSGAQVDRALRTTAATGRFSGKDLLSILDHQAGRDATGPTRAAQSPGLQPGTSARARIGTTFTPAATGEDSIRRPLRSAPSATAPETRWPRPSNRPSA